MVRKACLSSRKTLLLTLQGLPARSEVKPPDDQSILNERRPLNPFTTTKEPDWVMIPKASENRPLLEPSNGSVILPPGSGQNPRRLPPPFNPTPNPPMSAGQDSTQVQSSASSQRSRTSSQESGISTFSRKPAPPVPKKPALLSKTSDQNPDQGDRNTDRGGTGTARSPLPNATRSLPTLDATAPPLPRRTPGRSPVAREQEVFPQRSPEADGPPLPPRRPEGPQNSMGLMDDDIEGASAIPSLQPQRHG